MTALPGARDHALPVLSGVLLALSFPPAPLAPLVFLALVPLLLFIADRSPDDRGRWRATRGGALTGLVYFGIQLYWMAVALLRYSLLAIPAYLGAVLVLGHLREGLLALLRDRRVEVPAVSAGVQLRVPGDRNSSRYPEYRRIDMGLTREAVLAPRSPTGNPVRLELTGEVLNVFDMTNTISYSYVAGSDGIWQRIPTRLTPRTVNVRMRLSF